MGRFIDSQSLFAYWGRYSTFGDITCNYCKKVYNELPTQRETIFYTIFLGSKVCSNCFEELEGKFFDVMPYLISWLKEVMVADYFKREMPCLDFSKIEFLSGFDYYSNYPEKFVKNLSEAMPELKNWYKECIKIQKQSSKHAPGH